MRNIEYCYNKWDRRLYRYNRETQRFQSVVLRELHKLSLHELEILFVEMSFYYLSIQNWDAWKVGVSREVIIPTLKKKSEDYL